MPASDTPGTDGTPMTVMPAARALAAPVGESSSAMQSAGADAERGGGGEVGVRRGLAVRDLVAGDRSRRTCP